MSHSDSVTISAMLAVPDAAAAAAWYRQALDAEELWNLGSVIGLSIAGAPIFLGEPPNNGWDYPARLGMPSVRVEFFCDDPDAVISRAVAAGANPGSASWRSRSTLRSRSVGSVRCLHTWCSLRWR